MEIIRSKQMGLCYGVSAAIKKCHDIINDPQNKNKKIYILGMLVHNEYVVNKLNEAGFNIINEEELLVNSDKLRPGDIVIIRAHGTTKEIYELLHSKNIEVYDATCLFVSQTREILKKQENEGADILFVGDKDHPEVKGIISFGNRVTVCKDMNDIKKMIQDKDRKYAVLTQTTLSKEMFKEITDYLKDEFKNIMIFDTICGATQIRQSAAKVLAGEVDTVLVVGGKNSSNTKKLYDISVSINPATHLIQDERDLDISWFKNVKKVGITAGASTPDEIITKIESKLRGLTDV